MFSTQDRGSVHARAHLDGVRSPSTTDSNRNTPLSYTQYAPAHQGLSSSHKKQPPQIMTVRNGRRCWDCRSLLPTLIVFMFTCGLGLGLLAWLYFKRKTSLAEAFRSGYLLVDEGTKKKNGAIENARLSTLTATSFISTFITLTAPILMSLIAYRVTYLWVTERQRSPGGHVLGLTPLQYGLMLQVLGSSSLGSFYNSICYLFRGTQRRAKVPGYFKTAVTLGLLVWFMTHLVGLADLWLHATTTAVLHNTRSGSSSSSPLLASMNFNEALCDESDFPPANGICMTSSDGWAQTIPELISAGQLAASNSSNDRITITLADASDMAVTVPLAVEKLVSFKATTFGMRARCRSLNSLCVHSDVASLANCSNLGVTAIPTFDMMNVALVQTVQAWDGPQMASSDLMTYGISQCCTPNPATTVLQLRWSSQTDGGTEPPNAAVDTYPIPSISIYAACSIEVFNATLRYDGSTGSTPWSLVEDETVTSEERFASSLIAPYSWQLINDWITTNVRARAMSTQSSDEVMAALNQELARLALAFVSGSFVLAPATEVQILAPMVLGQYQVLPLLVFVGLLVLYGSFALVVFIVSLGMASDTVEIPSELRRKQGSKSVFELKLASERLLGPLPIVAQFFGESRSASAEPGEPDALSVKEKSLDMYQEGDKHQYRETRLRIGIEGGSERPRFGVWKH